MIKRKDECNNRIERFKIFKFGEYGEEYFVDTQQEIVDYDDYLEIDTMVTMSNEQVVDKLNEQQFTIEKQEEIIKSQDLEISRQYNLCLAMSGVLREEFGVYDVFDRTKDKKKLRDNDE